MATSSNLTPTRLPINGDLARRLTEYEEDESFMLDISSIGPDLYRATFYHEWSNRGHAFECYREAHAWLIKHYL